MFKHPTKGPQGDPHLVRTYLWKSSTPDDPSVIDHVPFLDENIWSDYVWCCKLGQKPFTMIRLLQRYAWQNGWAGRDNEDLDGGVIVYSHEALGKGLNEALQGKRNWASFSTLAEGVSDGLASSSWRHAFTFVLFFTYLGVQIKLLGGDTYEFGKTTLPLRIEIHHAFFTLYVFQERAKKNLDYAFFSLGAYLQQCWAFGWGGTLSQFLPTSFYHYDHEPTKVTPDSISLDLDVFSFASRELHPYLPFLWFYALQGYHYWKLSLVEFLRKETIPGHLVYAWYSLVKKPLITLAQCGSGKPVFSLQDYELIFQINQKVSNPIINALGLTLLKIIAKTFSLLQNHPSMPYWKNYLIEAPATSNDIYLKHFLAKIELELVTLNLLSRRKSITLECLSPYHPLRYLGNSVETAGFFSGFHSLLGFRFIGSDYLSDTIGHLNLSKYIFPGLEEIEKITADS